MMKGKFLTIKLLLMVGRKLSTECQNVGVGRMITKALSKSPWGAGLVNTDVGYDDRLAEHNL
eukprot:1161364-Pelagomonas_calceolata.AAC.4